MPLRAHPAGTLSAMRSAPEGFDRLLRWPGIAVQARPVKAD
ncbi:hypothetical protein [Methanoculleus frigidifontis]|nr:hypothetical protein [Methanoculleus sp. FWC-SCC1]